MKRTILFLSVALLFTATSDARLLKNLGKALKAAEKVTEVITSDSKSKSTPSAKTQASAATPAQSEVSRPTPAVSITPESIGPVAPGGSFPSLPASVAGLYDKVEMAAEDMEDMGEVIKVIKATFMLDGRKRFEAVGDADGIWYVALLSPDIKVSLGDRMVGLGDSLSALKGARGVVIPSEMGYAAECGNLYFDTDTSGNICAISWGTMM